MNKAGKSCASTRQSSGGKAAAQSPKPRRCSGPRSRTLIAWRSRGSSQTWSAPESATARSNSRGPDRPDLRCQFSEKTRPLCDVSSEVLGYRLAEVGEGSADSEGHAVAGLFAIRQNRHVLAAVIG